MNKLNTLRTIKKIINRVGRNPAYINHYNQMEFAPFALFDAGRVPNDRPENEPLDIDWHPHSGVATITFPYDCNLQHSDSAGNSGVILDQGLQWMSSGKGIWHKETYVPVKDSQSKIKPFGIMQLWLMLDPEEEAKEPSYFNLQPKKIPQVKDEKGNITRILLGEYQDIPALNRIKHNASYLDVYLKKGQAWRYQPVKKQIRGFVYPRVGSLKIGDEKIRSEQLALLEESENGLEILAIEDCQFVVALVEPWPHPVVQHYGQIHTSTSALKLGSEHIQKTKLALIKQLNAKETGAQA